MDIKTFKTRIYPTKEQEEYFNKAFNVRRWCWNWGLERYIESWKNDSEIKKYLTNYDLSKMINSIKDIEFPWLNEVNGMVRQEVFRDLKKAVDAYFNSLKNAKRKGIYFNPQVFKPKFKKKKENKDTFRYHIKNREQLPIKILSKHHFSMITAGYAKGNQFSGHITNRLNVKSRESLLFLNSPNYRVCEYTFTRSCGKYYLSISYERTNQRKLSKPDDNTCIGIDMGVKHALTCYDGNESWYFDIPESLKSKYEKRTIRKQRQLSQKYENIKQYNKNHEEKIDYNHSKHYQKLHLQLSKCYNKENNVKKDFRENYTTWLVQNYHTIKIEEYNFNLQSMSNMHMARSVARIGGWNFVERLKDKSKEYGTNLIFIPKFTPTTQTCSCCGHRYTGNEKLGLNDRVYHCPKCNTSIDRDVNASINIFNFKPLEQVN